MKKNKFDHNWLKLVYLLRFAWLLCFVGMIYMLFSGLTLESNILKLLPKYESEKANAVIQKVTENINSKIIVMASMSDEQSTDDFLNQMSLLHDTGYFKEILYQIDVEQTIGLYKQLNPFRFNLLSQEDRQSHIKKPTEFAALMVAMAQEQLYGLSAINGKQMKEDPLFLFQRYLNQLAQLSAFDFDTSRGYFEVEGGIDKVKVNDTDIVYGLHMFAFLELNDSAYSPKIQRQVENVLSRLGTHQNESAHVPAIKWSSFGTVRYASAAYKQAKNEISTVGVGSMIGISLLFLLAFRSLLPLLLSLTVIVSGLVVALTLTGLIFGQVHVFALVFGATIAGVSIDYCFHYLIESQEKSNAQVDVKMLAKPLLLGFSSSALVYLGFTITGYQVLAQISVFSVLGLLAVLIQVLLFFPVFVRKNKAQAPRIIRKIADFIYINPLGKWCAHGAVLSLLFIMTIGFLWFYYQPNDDVRALQSLSSELKQQEVDIKQKLSWQATDSYLIFQSEKLNDVLLQENQALSIFRQQGHVVFGVSDVVPTSNQQNQNQRIHRALYTDAVVLEYLNTLGLESPKQYTDENVAVFKADSRFNAEKLMTNSALSALISQRFIGQVTGLWTVVLPVESHYDRSMIPQALLIQQAEDTSALFALFRVKSTWMLGVAIVLLLLVLAGFKYTMTAAYKVVMVPVVAGLLALLISQVLGFHISLFSILGQLLVLGMGIDYVVFLKESKHPQIIMRALLLSACTTILAFGLLTLSQVAVISSFGFTVGMGIILVLFMSPAVTQRGEKYAI